MFANKILNTCSPGGNRVGLRWQSSSRGKPVPTVTKINTDIFMNSAYWGELLCANINQRWIETSYSGQWQLETHKNQELYYENGHIAFKYTVDNDKYIKWWIYPYDNPSESGYSYFSELKEVHGDLTHLQFPFDVEFYNVLFGKSLDNVWCDITTPSSQPSVTLDRIYQRYYGNSWFGYRDSIINPVNDTTFYQLYWCDLRNQVEESYEYEYHSAIINNASFANVATCHYDTVNDELILNSGTHRYVFGDSVSIYPCDTFAGSPFGILPQTITCEKIIIPVEYTITT